VIFTPKLACFDHLSKLRRLLNYFIRNQQYRFGKKIKEKKIEFFGALTNRWPSGKVRSPWKVVFL